MSNTNQNRDRIILLELLAGIDMDYCNLPETSTDALVLVSERIQLRRDAAELDADAIHSAREIISSMEAEILRLRGLLGISIPASDDSRFESDYA